MEMSYPLNLDEYIGAEVVQLWHYGRTTGVFSADDNLRVSPGGGMNIVLSSGVAWLTYSKLGGIVYGNTDPITFTLSLGDAVLNRIDRVVIRYDIGANVKPYAMVKSSSLASNPTAPALQRDLEAYELGLFDIRVNAGTSTITQAMITDQRLNPEVCGLVRDGVERIPTEALYAQWNSWFTNLKSGSETNANELTAWINLFKLQTTQLQDQWFSDFTSESVARFEELARQIEDIIDETAAGELLNIINGHINSSVNDENGVHQIRQHNGFIQTYRDGQWSGVRAGNATPNVSGFRAVAGDDFIALNWFDPQDIVIEGIEFAKWSRTRVVARNDRFPMSENDGRIVGESFFRDEYSIAPLLDTGLLLGVQYFYQAFPISDSNIVNRNIENRTSATTQSAPPGDVVNFTAIAGNSQITLTWGDPPDITDPVNIVWAGTKIIRSYEAPPINEFDGVLIVDSIIRNQYQTTGFTDTGLENGVVYYYQAFPYSTTGAVNRNETNRISATPVGYRIYGVRIDETNSNPETAVEYTDDAVGMIGGSFDWDETPIFSGIKPCILLNGIVQSYLNPNNFAQKEDGSAADITSGNAGDIMIEFPKMAFMIYREGNYLYVKITDAPNAKQIDDRFWYGGHTRETDGDCQHLYIGAYLAYGNDVHSLSGKPPVAYRNIESFRSYAQARGQGYDIVSFHPLTLLQCLYLIRYKNLDSQTALGQGYVVGGTAAQATGATNTSGMYHGNPANGTSRMKFAGIEDFWGNLYWWIDGLYSDANRNMMTAFQNFNNTGSGYTNRGQGATANISGYMTRAQGTSESGFIAKIGGGSATTYYADSAYLYASRLPVFGGYWSDDADAGAFNLRVNNPELSAAASVGARLMYLKKEA